MIATQTTTSVGSLLDEESSLNVNSGSMEESSLRVTSHDVMMQRKLPNNYLSCRQITTIEWSHRSRRSTLLSLRTSVDFTNAETYQRRGKDDALRS